MHTKQRSANLRLEAQTLCLCDEGLASRFLLHFELRNPGSCPGLSPNRIDSHA